VVAIKVLHLSDPILKKKNADKTIYFYPSTEFVRGDYPAIRSFKYRDFRKQEALALCEYQTKRQVNGIYSFSSDPC
jgi:hypothetical protein